MLGRGSSGPGLGSGGGSGRWVGRKPGKEEVSVNGDLDLGVPPPFSPLSLMRLGQPLGDDVSSSRSQLTCGWPRGGGWSPVAEGHSGWLLAQGSGVVAEVRG